MYWLTVVHKTAGMFYYFFHNVVWVANMGVIYRHAIEDTLGWRDLKDSFSLLSNITESIKSYIKLSQIQKKVNETMKKLDKLSEQNASRSELQATLVKLLTNRAKRRQCWLSVISSCFRIIQLTYRLKFTFARKYYHPIFVVVCRILAISISLFKIWQ